MDITKPDSITVSPPHLRVLILEDNPRDAKLIASVLEGGGGRVKFEVTDSPEVFRERLEKDEYDVILADFNLRNWTAIDALETLKHSGKDIPLIVVTGSLGDESAVECIKQGAADFVLKDRPARLPTAVQRALEEKRLRNEKKRSEVALMAERHLLHTLMDNLPDVIYFKDRESHFTRINQALAKLFGLSDPAQAVGKTDFDFFSIEHAQKAYNDEQEIIRTGQPMVSQEEKEIWPDGHATWVLTTKMPLRDDNGNVTGTFGVSRDITKRKRAEETLRKSERRYRQLHESMRDGFVRVDMEGKITEANDAFCRMLGYKPEELLKMTYEDLTPEQWHVFESDIIEGEVLTRGYSEIYLKEYTRKSGAVIPVEIRNYLMLDESGNACGMWAIVRDITERKWAEQMQQEYEKVVEGSDEMIAVVDREYCYLLANRAFLEQRGLERKDVVGSSVPEVLGEDVFVRVVKEKLDECFQGNVVRCEMKLQYPKIGERDILVSYFPIEGYHGVDRAACVLQDITERKRAEEALYQSRQMLKSILDTIPQRVFWKDRNIVYLGCNQAFAIDAGLKDPAEIIGKNDYELAWRETAELYRADDKLVIEGESPRLNFEEPQNRLDGSLIWLRTSKLPLRDREGKVIGMIGTYEDITEHKRAEERLQEYEKALEGLDEMIVVVDREYRYVIANRAYLNLRGLTREQLMGQLVPDISDKDIFNEVVKKRMDECFQGKVVKYEVRYKDPKIGERDVFISYFPIEDPAGIDRIVCVLLDITERKRAEAENIRLRTAIEQAAEGVVVTDAEGDIQYVNPAFSAITGYSREEAFGKNTRILKSGKQDAAFYASMWATILAGKVWKGEMTNRRKDGSLYTEKMSITPVHNEHGKLTHFVAMKEDITARKLLEDQFRQAQKMEAVGRLAAGVAHDFNNLLTIIIGYSDVMLDQLFAGDPMRAYATEIKGAGERAVGLTRQLLAFSRQQVLAPQVLDLNTLIANLSKLLRRLIGEDIDLVFTPGPSPAIVKADPGQIEQVLMNLAVNSRDAMPRGGKLTIETSQFQVDEAYSSTHFSAPVGLYTMLAVSDTGCGMDKDIQAHIFEPFFTTKEQGKGTGLGLATVYGIVKQSGGNIWVYSEPGAGTTFKIYLPAVKGALEAAQESAVPAGGTETILLVEDDAGLRELARMVLVARGGYKVLVSIGGKEARLFAEQYKETIHLLLTDVVMPGMSGRELSEQLAAVRPEMKILYMSGYTDDTVLRHGVLEEGRAFLQKPFTAESLLRKVRDVLDTRPHA